MIGKINDYDVKDSGQRQTFTTGAQRDCEQDKGRYDLLPCRALQRIARHFEKGAKKYDARNWEKGMSISRYLDSALRHAFGYMEGKDDEDHLVAAAWNLLCALDTESRIKEGVLPKDLMDLGPHTGGGKEKLCTPERQASSKVRFDEMLNDNLGPVA